MAKRGVVLGLGSRTRCEQQLVRSGAPCVSAPKPELPNQVRLAVRMRHDRRRTKDADAMRMRGATFFHGVRHPASIGESEIRAFLTHSALKEPVSASTRNQALAALLFLYRNVLGREVGDLGQV
jgi:hypothetical protein